MTIKLTQQAVKQLRVLLQKNIKRVIFFIKMNAQSLHYQSSKSKRSRHWYYWNVKRLKQALVRAEIFRMKKFSILLQLCVLYQNIILMTLSVLGHFEKVNFCIKGFYHCQNSWQQCSQQSEIRKYNQNVRVRRNDKWTQAHRHHKHRPRERQIFARPQTALECGGRARCRRDCQRRWYHHFCFAASVHDENVQASRGKHKDHFVRCLIMQSNKIIYFFMWR